MDFNCGHGGDCCKCTLHHGACECCGICTGYQHVRQWKMDVKPIAKQYTIWIKCIDMIFLLIHTYLKLLDVLFVTKYVD